MHQSAPETLVIIGNGPVGVHLVNQLLRHGWQGRITIFGEEETLPYNRVQLSALLNRDVTLAQIQNHLPDHEALTQLVHCRVVHIDRERKTVTDAYGHTHPYTKLVLATGSRPHIPHIPGTDLPGVYRFRDLRDVETLYARQGKTRNTVIIGGGLLGLETARAMSRFSTQVSVIQHTATLMNRQLDAEASAMIQSYAESLGIRFFLNERAQEITGNERVEGISLGSGGTLACDTLIFATGIIPNRELASDAGLSVRAGIQINSRLQTSDPDIHAIGECADYEGQVFGLVAPGLEQASILAANLCGGKRLYRGSMLASELKVLNLDVLSMGEVGEIYPHTGEESLIYREAGKYRRLFLYRGKLTGAIGVGDWPQYKAIQNLIGKGTWTFPWQRQRFLKTGDLLRDQQNTTDNLPASTLICNCQQVSLGQIRQCLKTSEKTLPALQERLGVATVCGTCKPLVQQILQVDVEKQPVRIPLLALSLVALCVTVFLLAFPSLPFTQFTTEPGWDWLWTDSLARQVTGFTILGLTALSLLLTLRKRVRKVSWPAFDLWRFTHVLLALLALTTLVAHTGVSLGEGINRWLIINFMLIALVGVGSAVVSALEGNLISTGIKRVKRTLVLCHIVVFWPLPILLGFHVMSVYYF